MYVYVHVYTYVCHDACLYLHMHGCMMHGCMYVCIHGDMYVFKQIYMYPWRYMYACLYVCALLIFMNASMLVIFSFPS